MKDIFVGNLDYETSEDELVHGRTLNVNEARRSPERTGGGWKGRERRRSGGRW